MRRDFFEGQRGQTSIEIALVTGVIFIVFISAFPYVTDMNAMNKGVAAARDGAIFAQTMFNMGYAQNATLPLGEKVILEDMSYSVDTTTEPGIKIVSITLTISGTTDDAVATEMKNQAGNYIFYNFNGVWNTSTGGTVTTGNYRFEVTSQFA
jgi:hypothetical protein